MAQRLHQFVSESSRGRRLSRAAREAPATTLGPWQLVELAAEGSFSRVFRAQPAGSAGGACYAVKQLKEEFQDDPRAVSLLRREARVGRTLSNPHLTPVLDFHVDTAPYYVVMPWLDGASLSAELAAVAAPVLTSHALWIARQVAQGLAAVDEAGWMHGDVKPANIMISPVGHVTLVDLGLARRPADEDQGSAAVLVGTPWYMAPETLLGVGRSDIRSDIYSLGVVLYEMLAGRRPFTAIDAAELVTAHRTGPIVQLRELAPTVPPELAKLVHAMLAREPLRRPQNAREVVNRLVALEVAYLDEELSRAVDSAGDRDD